MNWTSSYSFHGKDDPDEEMDDEEVYATLKKIEALYEQAKSGIGGGGKVCKAHGSYNMCFSGRL